MSILAIDTSGDDCSVGISQTDGKKCTLLISETLTLKTQHAEALVPMIGRVLKHWGGPLHGLKHCAVTVGPGSFTGVRIGISAAKAIGLALKIPVYGISTLSALCAPYREEFRESYALFSTVLDARHGAVFIACYDALGIPLLSPTYLTKTAAAEWLHDHSHSLLLTGSGAKMLKDQLPEQKNIATLCAKDAPKIAWVARLSCEEKERLTPCPVYLREPDAKIPQKPQIQFL
jgi:tRNA threonylcarbamoyl adenosine modification protein YeaZ